MNIVFDSANIINLSNNNYKIIDISESIRKKDSTDDIDIIDVSDYTNIKNIENTLIIDVSEYMNKPSISENTFPLKAIENANVLENQQTANVLEITNKTKDNNVDIKIQALLSYCWGFSLINRFINSDVSRENIKTGNKFCLFMTSWLIIRAIIERCFYGFLSIEVVDSWMLCLGVANVLILSMFFVYQICNSIKILKYN